MAILDRVRIDPDTTAAEWHLPDFSESAVSDPRQSFVRSGFIELIDGTQLPFTPSIARLMSSIIQGLCLNKVMHLEFDDPEVTPDRAAEMLGVSRPTVYAWQDRGLLDRRDQGNRRMVSLASVFERIDARQEANDLVSQLTEVDMKQAQSADSEVPDYLRPSPTMEDAFRRIDQGNAESRGAASDEVGGSAGCVCSHPSPSGDS